MFFPTCKLKNIGVLMLKTLKNICSVEYQIHTHAYNLYMAASETEEDIDIKAALRFEALEHKRKADLKYLYSKRYAAFYYRSKTASAKREEVLKDIILDIKLESFGGEAMELEDDLGDLDYLTTS